MKRLRIPGSVLILLAALILSAACAAAEGSAPPSPEPPAAYMEARPTPAPTEAPDGPIIDHIHNPRYYPELTFPEDRKMMEIWFPNVRDADMAVILYDGQTWLIDCGDERAAAHGQQLLRQLGIERIDRLFNTHLHHDHIDGLAMTDDVAKVGEVRICFPPDLTSSGMRLIRVAEERGIPVKEYRDGDTFTMGDGEVEWRVLKNDGETLDMNNQSAQIMIAYGQRRILFMADMEAPGQQAMIERTGADALRCDIVKYPHHAKTEMYDPFFRALGAGMAVATSVEGRADAGQYFLFNRHLPTAYTSVRGMFTRLVTDGRYWLCEQVPITVR